MSYILDIQGKCSNLVLRKLKVLLSVLCSLVLVWKANASEPRELLASHYNGNSQSRIEQFQFNESKIYPGTTRTVTVYIPVGINPEIPACVYVCQDGFNPDFAAVFDTLIAQGEMPVTVGIFITPGKMAYPSQSGSYRDNRSYEYNCLGDEYARFLLEEIIPLVAVKYHLNLSEDPNCRGIGGCSSGGISAFNVAWERPDAFRRVYNSCGSFAAYEGGNIFPALIRKYEPKPIRTFLLGAKKDLNNEGGNFWLIYKEMEDALSFSGYNYKSKETSGGHCESYSTSFAEAMRWLWRDYPEPVKAGIGPAFLQTILYPEEKWVEQDVGSVQISSLAAGINSEIFFNDGLSGCINKIGQEGQVSTFSTSAANISGLTDSPEGAVYGISEKERKIFEFDSNGGKRLVAKDILGKRIIAIGNDSFYTIGKEKGEGKIWYIGKSGKAEVAASGLLSPSSCDILNDKLFFITDSCSHWVNSYMIGEGNSLLYKEHSIWLDVLPVPGNEFGAGSVIAASDGKIFISCQAGIWAGGDQPYSNQGIIVPPQTCEIKRICI